MSIMEKLLKLSEVAYIYPDYDEGKHLIVSNSTGASALVNTEIMNFLEKMRTPSRPQDLVGMDWEGCVQGLFNAQVIIDSEEDGLKLMEKAINKAKANNELAVIPIVTNQCNMACPYCFEAKSKEYMDSALVKRMIDYTTQRMDNENITNIYTSLFGGEPLLNQKACREWIDGLSGEVKKRNGKLNVALITNGSLLTKEFAEYLSRFDSMYIQITIDGPKEIHDKRRPLKSGKSSYDVLMEKLLLVAESGVKLQLRVNVDNENQPYISVLLEDLVKRGLNKANVIVDLARVMANTKSNCTYSHNCIPAEDYGNAVFEHVLNFNRAGFNTYAGIFKAHRPICCSAYSGKHIAVTPNGDLYACLDGIGDERFVVGNIWNEEIYNSRMKEWSSVSPLNFEKCRKCPSIGFCGAGCGAEALNKCGSLDRETVCPPFRWTHVGGVVLPAKLRKEFMEAKNAGASGSKTI